MQKAKFILLNHHQKVNSLVLPPTLIFGKPSQAFAFINAIYMQMSVIYQKAIMNLFIRYAKNYF